MKKETAAEIILNIIKREENLESNALAIGEINALKKAYCALNPDPFTNADRIRSFSDEELAHWLEDNLCHAFCPDDAPINPETKECLYHDGNCWMCILDWLREETNQ